MKYLLAALLCICLCGCEAPAQAAPEPTAAATVPQKKAGMYDPNHPMEQANPGLVRAYPLTMRKVRSILPFGDDVLTLSGYGCTTLTLLTGEELREEASFTLDTEIPGDDPSLQIHEDAFSLYHPGEQATLVFSRDLQEIRRIAAPEGLTGSPILSRDQNTLYYCTGRAVMAWDLESGIRRILRELFCDSQELIALHPEASLVQCLVREGHETRQLLLRTDNGVEAASLPEKADLFFSGAGYLASLPAGYQQQLLFARLEEEPQLLLPRDDPQASWYLPADHGAVTATQEAAGTRLCYYELSTGHLRSELVLEAPQTPKAIANTDDHALYILAYDPEADCDTLYRWDVLRQPPDPANTTVWAEPYLSREDPEEMARCRLEAEAIASKYGIRITIGDEALQPQPWDYSFTPEYQPGVLLRQLETLDQLLGQYPPVILEKTASHFSAVTFHLVRGITGSGDARSLNTATGIQYLQDGEAHVAVAGGRYFAQSLCHEFYHVMETHILNESTALDRWNDLNPAGFAYNQGYGSQPEGQRYLAGETRAFVDSYSMSYSKEDRARVLEYAMLPGQEALFRTEYMQRKLTALCLGIREAYGLKKHPEALPWEQYLVNDLIPDP